MILRLVVGVCSRTDVALRVVDLRSLAELVVRVLLDGEVALLSWSGVRNARLKHRRLRGVGRAPAALRDELVVWRSVVDLTHALLVGTRQVGRLRRAVREEVTPDERHV